MFADSRFDYLGKVRYYTAVAVTPLHLMADLPARIASAFDAFFEDRNALELRNASLEEELLMLQFKLQKLEHLEAENRRLSELLKASTIVDEVAVRAQLVGESSDPFSKRVLINKGSNDGVFIGQPVVDAYGLMGQVIEVEPLVSWVLLITDPLHATPVQVNRNGLRAIAAGTPDSLHQLTLENVSASADIQVGDVLVTSGLDQHLPTGYPVGVVSSIENDPGRPFATVRVKPTAEIDRSRNLLLLFTAPQAITQSTDAGDTILQQPVLQQSALAPASEPAVDVAQPLVPSVVPLVEPPVDVAAAPSVQPAAGETASNAEVAAPAAATPVPVEAGAVTGDDSQVPRFGEGRE